MAYDNDAAPRHIEVLTWEGLATAVADLARQVRAAAFKPTVILAIGRGGMVPAGMLTHQLAVKLTDVINVEFYADSSQAVPDPILLAPMLDTSSIAGQRLLVVDDVADTGHTLAHVVKLLRGFGAEVRSAVVYTKPATVITPDFQWRCVDDWVVFPWAAESDNATS